MQHPRALLWQILLRLASSTSMPAWMWMQHYGIPTRRYTRVTDGGTELRMVPDLPVELHIDAAEFARHVMPGDNGQGAPA
jgi:hypothetical protein